MTSSDTIADPFPDPRLEPVMSIERAGRLYGLTSRTAAYDAAGRGDIPTLRIGRRLVVPTATAARQLGLRAEDFR